MINMFRNLFLVAMIFLVGCELPAPIKSGIITNMGYVPATQIEVPVVVSEIQIGDISFPVYGTETVDCEEYWFFIIENENTKGEVVNREIRVGKDWYDKQKIGDWVEIQE